jgi:hypothetical protein
MKITTGTAMRLLQEANPAPDGAFADAARDQDGQASLMAILGSSVAPAMPEGAAAPTRRRILRAAIPATALTAALATGLAVALLLTGEPAPGNPPGSAQATSGTLAALVADLTAHPPARPGDASAELRRLADIAAAQPAPRSLGPVEYSQAKVWGLDLGKLHYGLGYRSHDTSTQEAWVGSDGAALDVITFPGGKVPPGLIPVHRSGPSAQGKAYFSKWADPASLPTSESLMRQHLLSWPIACHGCDIGQDQTIVSLSTGLMIGEPLPPAARAAMLRVLADTAANPGPGEAFYDLGSVTDRAGHKAVAIAWESGSTGLATGTSVASGHASGHGGAVSSVQSPLRVLVFDPDTGALLGQEYAYCNEPVGSHLATGSCFATSYDQILEIKAVPAIPATPAGPSPTDTATP